MMTNRFRAILSAALCFALIGSGCAATSAQEPSSQVPASSVVQQESSGAASPEASSIAASGIDVQTSATPLMVADAAQYRGVLEDVAVDDQGRTVWVLAQAAGTDFGAPRVQVTLDENSTFSFDSATVGNGAYLEVYYGGSLPTSDGQTIPTVTAIAVNALPPADICLFNGTFVEITNDEGDGKGSMLLEAMDGRGQFVFHYGPDVTSFRMDEPSQWKPGQKVNIYFSGASTMSLPPQSTALEVSPYAEPDASAPQPVASLAADEEVVTMPEIIAAP